MSLSYRNQSTDLQSRSIEWLLYERGIDRKRVDDNENETEIEK